MKQKSKIIILMAIVLSLSLIVSSAWAGNKQRHRWEGVAIGIGAAVLGSTLLHNYSHSHPPPKVVYRYGPPRHGHYYPNRHRSHYNRGHYKGGRHRVSPHRKVWNPGHYNRRGYWVPGRWMVIERGHDHRVRDRARIDRRRDHRRW